MRELSVCARDGGGSPHIPHGLFACVFARFSPRPLLSHIGGTVRKSMRKWCGHRPKTAKMALLWLLLGLSGQNLATTPGHKALWATKTAKRVEWGDNTAGCGGMSPHAWQFPDAEHRCASSSCLNAH